MQKRNRHKKTQSQMCYLLGAHFSHWLYNKPACRRITPYQISQHIAAQAKEFFSERCVWDLFSNIGSDVLWFSQYFEKVYFSEPDQIIVNMCRRNVEKFGLTNALYHPVDLQDTSTWPKDVWVFLNPAWGVNYEATHKERFQLDQVELENGMLFEDLFRKVHFEQGLATLIVVPTRSTSFVQKFPPQLKFSFTELTFLFYK